jgi:hypothetical protein
LVGRKHVRLKVRILCGRILSPNDNETWRKSPPPPPFLARIIHRGFQEETWTTEKKLSTALTAEPFTTLQTREIMLG